MVVVVGALFWLPPYYNGGGLLLPLVVVVVVVVVSNCPRVEIGAVNPCGSEGESINLPTALTAVARLRSRGRRRGLVMLCVVVLC